MIAWQGGLYRLGGCISQNGTTGVCDNTISAYEYGVVNQDGDASTVSNSSRVEQRRVVGYSDKLRPSSSR
ncbi:hypothetical protein IPL68_04545 [Candidatus Saccharibacteria bacterium]|nr:MAG: hypothetical protein IPL68_04545 [Candidatus Saccharibacteria bacterium]